MGLLDKTMPVDLKEDVLHPGRGPAIERPVDQRPYDVPDFRPAILCGLSQGPRMLRSRNRAIGIVVQLDVFRSPPQQQRKAVGQQKVDHHPQRRGPALHRTDGRLRPVLVQIREPMSVSLATMGTGLEELSMLVALEVSIAETGARFADAQGIAVPRYVTRQTWPLLSCWRLPVGRPSSMADIVKPADRSDDHARLVLERVHVDQGNRSRAIRPLDDDLAVADCNASVQGLRHRGLGVRHRVPSRRNMR